METKLIFQRMADINKEIDEIGKNGQTDYGEKFKYRKVDDLLNALAPLFKKHNVFISPKVVETIQEDRTTKNGGHETYLRLGVEYTFYTTDGSSVVVGPILGEGMDGRDKAANKAMSAAFKNGMFQTFCIAVGAVDSEIDGTPAQRPERNNNHSQQRTQTPTPTINIDKTYGDGPGQWVNALTKDGKLTNVGKEIEADIKAGKLTLKALVDAGYKLNKQEKEYLINVKREQPAQQQPVQQQPQEQPKAKPALQPSNDFDIKKPVWASIGPLKRKELLDGYGKDHIMRAYIVTGEEEKQIDNYFKQKTAIA